MWDLIFDWANAPFLAALVLAPALAAAELLGAGRRLVPEMDGERSGGDSGRAAAAARSLLKWLNPGGLRSSVMLLVFLVSFGVIGLIGQQITLDGSGRYASLLIATPLTLAVALPVTRLFGRALAYLLPEDAATPAGDDALVGRVAVIVAGAASPGAAAQARVESPEGGERDLMVEPDAADEMFAEGEAVRLVRRAGATFFAVREPNGPSSGPSD
jgi:hypothetical protein